MRHSPIIALAFAALAVPVLAGSATTVPADGPTEKSTEVEKVAATPSSLALDAAAAIRSGDTAAVFNKANDHLSEIYTSANFDAAALIDPAVVRCYLAYFGRVEKPTAFDRETIAWLITQPRLASALVLALGGYDAPDRVLAVLQALREGCDTTQFETNADLIAALCVVWDNPNPRAGVAADTAGTEQAVRLYHYFTRGRGNLRYDPREIPWQLQVYTVDIAVSPNEILWALGRYAKRGNDIGTFYFDVPYDMAAFAGGAELKISKTEYTLPNLVKIGGICGDQAYFAEQVSRILGVPACAVTGQGGAGEVGHAWVGFMDRRGKQILWNFTNGRYQQQLYWTGSITDPQTREPISEAQVSVLSELQRTTTEQRRESLAIVRTVDIAPKDKQAELLMTAIDLSPGNREAWTKLAEMSAAMGLTDAQTDKLAAVVRDFAAKSYADFAVGVYRKMIAGRSNLEQIDRLEALSTLFKDRPDLVAALRIDQGKLLEGLKRDNNALKAYGDVLANHLYAGPIVLDAMKQTDDLLRRKGDIKRLIGIYDFVFNRMPKPMPSAFARTAPYVKLGTAYADTLDEFGDKAGAAKVRSRLTIFMTATGSAAAR